MYPAGFVIKSTLPTLPERSVQDDIETLPDRSGTAVGWFVPLSILCPHG